MNVREMAREIAKKTNVEVEVAQKVLYAMSGVAVAELKKGASVRLGSMGTFKGKWRAQKKIKNIRTGQTQTIPKRYAFVFHPAKQMKGL